MKKRVLWSMVVVLLAAAPAMADQPSCNNVKAIVNSANQEVSEKSASGVPTVVTLDGTNSNPKNSVTCQWTQKANESPQITITNPNACTASFTAPEVGPLGQEFNFDLKVTSTEAGCTGETNTKSTKITVKNVSTNLAPVAAATAPLSVNEGTVVTLDGSGSTDPDGNMLTYVWTQLSGGTPVTLNASGANATFTAPAELYPHGETLTFRLTVSDGTLSNWADVSIFVNSVNQPPVASVSCPATIAEGAQVTLDGSQSSDPDNGLLTYQWSQLAGVPNADLSAVNMTVASISFIAPALTNYPNDTMKFGLTVKDNGNATNSAVCNVKVLDVTPPVISGADNITKEATSGLGATVTFDPTAADAFYGSAEVSCEPASGGIFALGSTPVKCSASDKATPPNTATAEFSVIVEDTTPPSFTAPASFTALATSATGAGVTYATPTATDLVDGYFLATCSPAAGSAFALGTTTVTCGATDKHNNAAPNQYFNVTVNYGFNGLLAPYNATKAYKIKSAIPLKWQYTAANGTVLSSAGAKPTVLIYQVTNGVDATDAITLDDAGVSGYQYDSTTSTWQFNWKTTGLAAGTYDVYIQSAVTGQNDGPFKVQLVK